MARSRRRELTVFYYAVHDLGYPRNARIRGYLDAHPAVAAVRVHTKARLASRVRTKLSDLQALWRGSKGADIIVVSEFALPYAGPAAVVARVRGARLVVDGFVGAHETVIGDHQQHAERSWQAVRHRLTDLLAVRAADLFLIDTRSRAEAVRRGSKVKTLVVSLPVGAPDWAQPGPGSKSDRTRLLFYGNFLPLHGVDVIVAAVASMRRSTEVQLTLVGSSTADVKRQVRDAGLDKRCTFVPAVPAAELPDLIADSDAVLGVFGDSPKARTVIPNKVWQGLACGRTVITRASTGLDEIVDFVPDQLIVVNPPTSDELSAVLDRFVDQRTPTEAVVYPAARGVLDRYVHVEFAALGDWLVKA